MTRGWGALCLVITAGCGSSSPLTAPTPPEPITGTMSGTVVAYGIASHPITPAKAGTLTVTLTWTPAGDLDLYVTASACTGYPPDACTVLARSTASTGQREEVTLTVIAGAPLLIWVDSFHPQAGIPYAVTTVLR